MPAKVFCRKYQQELEGLVTPPFPGPKGLDIFNNISMKAWKEWQEHQVRLINEKALSMVNAEHRKFLQTEMDKFFSNQDFEKASGYVEEKSEKS